ncbi:olfactory receptor 2AT4-like [Protopterus annectens]|uniref:olfactory receptor 2AT4-like n=1 Tax=Protopterus annectens TaxID=7888 RepID=UPI001CFB61AE|nr:olfactory receptor 2AT4-like [Protopterus annectens]
MTHNESRMVVTEFILVGFPYLHHHQTVLFAMFSIIYLLILLGNGFILFAVLVSSKLHKPMHFFICNLASLDILVACTILPKMLVLFLINASSISFTACFAQLYILHSLGVSEGFLLAVMAYDRYVAICNPLRYTAIMTNRLNIQLMSGCWMLGMTVVGICVFPSASFPYCGSNIVNHCFCDLLFIVKLACTDISLITSLVFSFVLIFVLIPFGMVFFSYVKIICCVLKTGSAEGRQKAFSTCSSHLMVVVTYFTSLIITYVLCTIDNSSDEMHALGTIFFSIVTPTLNPVIYALRNKEVKDAATKFVKSKATCHSTGFFMYIFR